ncbi:MAG: hypothetical protein K8H74_18420 [Notoacmeibacter sp.]|nr:hypothetical protein [Notoacmeibacter sp.]
MTADVEILHHGRIAYRIIPPDDCLGLGSALHASGKKWHLHVLSPDCIHNPEPGRYGLVIEDDSDGIAYLAFSDEFPEVDKDLVKILHGDDILDTSKVSSVGQERLPASALLARIIEFDASGAEWHHHMHFPDCVFNPHRGQWSISVEDGKGNVFSETYQDEPADILREVEVIYFRRHDGDDKAS